MVTNRGQSLVAVNLWPRAFRVYLATPLLIPKRFRALGPGEASDEFCKFERSAKRHVITDTLGLLLAVAVTAASVHDSAVGTQLLTTVHERHPTITKAWADNGYKTKAVEHAARLSIDLEIVQRDPTTRGSHVQPRRWVIERTLGWLMHHRRLARDYETHPHRSTAMIQLAAINLMTRRLTHEATPNWRHS
ncbi:transposase [Streptomyces purpurascens]|uniref:transposase n=1 Tax=Streptomyces purpurascens TaxID=1924 RepID=UPI0033E0FDE7